MEMCQLITLQLFSTLHTVMCISVNVSLNMQLSYFNLFSFFTYFISDYANVFSVLNRLSNTPNVPCLTYQKIRYIMLLVK